MHHIYSTMANSTEYVNYIRHNPQGVNVVGRTVLIKGGSGINRQHMQTPLGVHTAISEEDFEWLQNDPNFKEHQKKGYIVVRKDEVHPEKVAADMATRQWVKDATGNVVRGDAFPVTPEDFSEKPVGEKLTAIKPTNNKKSKAA